MRNFKIHLGFCLALLSILLFSFSTMAQDAKTDAEFQKIVKEYTLNKDGSVTFHYAHTLTLFTYYSFTTAYGETHIVYNTKYQKVKVNTAKTTMADGKVVTSPQNAYNEILPGFCANAPAYNHIRDLVVTHTGLERNATVNVDYEVFSEPGFYPELMGNECLKTSSPVKEYIIRVKIPANSDKPLQYKLLNSEIEPQVTSDSTTTIYTWTFTNLPALSVEKFKPHLSVSEPYLLFSTSRDMQKLFFLFVNKPFLKFEGDEDMRKLVYRLLENKKSEIDFICKVQDVVANQVKTYNVPLNYTGYNPQTAIQVFHSNGGTPLEKASLMVALLNLGGIKAFPEWVAPSALVSKEIGNLNVFDEVYVRVYTDPQKYLHLPVASKPKNNMNLYSDYRTFVLLDPESKYANPVIVPLNQPQTYNYDFDLILDKPDHYSGTVKVTYNQGANPYFELLKDSTSQFARILQNVQIAKESKSKIESITPLQSKIEFDITSSAKAFLNEKDYWFLTLPKGTEGFDSWQLTALPDGRTTAIQLPAAINENYSFSLVLPKGYKLVGLPNNYNVSQINSLGSVITQIKMEKKKVVVTRSLVIKKSMIAPDEYKQLQEIVNVWRAEINKCLVFKAE